MYHVYIIECLNGTLYTGITTDVNRRFQEHRLGKGGAYTRANKAKKLLYTEQCKNRSLALKREAAIKRLPRAKKLALIKDAQDIIIKKSKINKKGVFAVKNFKKGEEITSDYENSGIVSFKCRCNSKNCRGAIN